MPIMSAWARSLQRPPRSRVNRSRTPSQICSESRSSPSRSKITASIRAAMIRRRPGGKDRLVLQLVRFSVAGQDYALPIERVREVIRYVEPRSLGEPEPWLRGVIDLRGELLRVCDLAVRLGAGPGAAGKIVVFDSPEGKAGLIVDEVDQVVAVDDAQLSPAPTAR